MFLLVCDNNFINFILYKGKQKMKNQKGMVNLDGVIPALILFGVAIGVVICLAIPWLWSFVKPFIHSITA